MVKKWRYLDIEDCPNCGNALEVLTSADEGYLTDGDEVRCVGQCDDKLIMYISADDDSCYVSEAWDD